MLVSKMPDYPVSDLFRSGASWISKIGSEKLVVRLSNASFIFPMAPWRCLTTINSHILSRHQALVVTVYIRHQFLHRLERSQRAFSVRVTGDNILPDKRTARYQRPAQSSKTLEDQKVAKAQEPEYPVPWPRFSDLG
ncbi:hypothetical protein FBY50_1814 [Zymomonas mobilis]|nr:hypothetical protein FBY50_1815 [Zymomonas mobilis]TWD58342.1 hypothetical protein FBY50_1814 [Zymomonas mobilis]